MAKKYGGAKLSTGSTVRHCYAQIGDIISGRPGLQREIALERQAEKEKRIMFETIDAPRPTAKF